MISYVLWRSSSYLGFAALLLLVLVAVVWNSLRRAPQRISPLGFGLYGAELALGVAVGLAILMAASMVISSSGSASDLLFLSIGMLFAWFFVVIWATVTVCTFMVFFATARFTSPLDEKLRHAELLVMRKN